MEPFISENIYAPIFLTLALAFLTTLILLIIGTPLAWWLARSKARWKDIVSALVIMPLVIPPTVLGFYLLILLGPDGPGGALQAFGGKNTSLYLFWTFDWFGSLFYALCCAAYS